MAANEEGRFYLSTTYRKIKSNSINYEVRLLFHRDNFAVVVDFGDIPNVSCMLMQESHFYLFQVAHSDFPALFLLI